VLTSKPKPPYAKTLENKNTRNFSSRQVWGESATRGKSKTEFELVLLDVEKVHSGAVAVVDARVVAKQQRRGKAAHQGNSLPWKN